MDNLSNDLSLPSLLHTNKLNHQFHLCHRMCSTIRLFKAFDSLKIKDNPYIENASL